MRRSFTEVWPVVHEERRRLVEHLSGLLDDQWLTGSSGCGEVWTTEPREAGR